LSEVLKYERSGYARTDLFVSGAGHIRDYILKRERATFEAVGIQIRKIVADDINGGTCCLEAGKRAYKRPEHVFS
jgi:hypothetical protein